jgi:hypothetical protein
VGKHYVPQKYLRGFASPADTTRVWMYDKKVDSWSYAAISKVAQQADYFDPETESELAQTIEAPAHQILDKVRRREALSNAERDSLAAYIAVMLMRVPRRRRKAIELVEPTVREVISETREQMRSEIESPDDELRFQEQLKNLERLERKFIEEPPPALTERIRSPWPSDLIFGGVRDMAWRFVATAGPSYFLTSDNPAYFFEGLGIGTPDAELTFPLSSDLALIGSWQGPKRSLASVIGKKPAIHGLVKEVNRRVATGAERFIFYRNPAAWVETLAQRPDPFLSRIIW